MEISSALILRRSYKVSHSQTLDRQSWYNSYLCKECKNVFTYFDLVCLIDQGSRLTFWCVLISAWKANWRWIKFGVFNSSTPKIKIPIVGLKIWTAIELDRRLGLTKAQVGTENSYICYWTGWSCSPLSVEIFPAFMALLRTAKSW